MVSGLVRSGVIIALLGGCCGFVGPITRAFAEFSVFTVIYNLRCEFRNSECCDHHSIVGNMTSLQASLKANVFGQHLAYKVVLAHVKAHLENVNPAKALVLSFHGGTGTGKNFVSSIIAKHLYARGMGSKFVHLISAPHTFKHREQLSEYKDQLQQWIEGNVTVCERSLFIFDEMHLMPTGLIDVLFPFLDYHEHFNGINYRKSIFIFLSNSETLLINNFVYNHWKNGKHREEIQLNDIERKLAIAAVNNNGGLFDSVLIKNHHVTAFVPFLPLERFHVKECIKKSIAEKNPDFEKFGSLSAFVTEVADQLHYFNEGAFSSQGCKRVSEKVDYVLLSRDF